MDLFHFTSSVQRSVIIAHIGDYASGTFKDIFEEECRRSRELDGHDNEILMGGEETRLPPYETCSIWLDATRASKYDAMVSILKKVPSVVDLYIHIEKEPILPLFEAAISHCPNLKSLQIKCGPPELWFKYDVENHTITVNTGRLSGERSALLRRIIELLDA
ncbi:hypothetical protein VKT23_017769 [Stygiomarasmius scandens]|uniref:Uncharacterized protein n=1 Tax=Marasmiellus scandens TaxID=2682957 RepID=A0ABR1IU75_9AGAR